MKILQNEEGLDPTLPAVSFSAESRMSYVVLEDDRLFRFRP